MWDGVRSNISGEDQREEHIFFLCWASLYLFAVLLFKWCRVVHGQLLGERPLNMEKQAAMFGKAAGVCCCAYPLWQCGICSAVSVCASLVMLQAQEGGNRYTKADDEHYSLSWFCGRVQEFKCCEGVSEVQKTKSWLVTVLEREMKK